MSEKLIFSCSAYYEVEDGNGVIKRVYGQADPTGEPGAVGVSGLFYKRGWQHRTKRYER